ncbi:MAG: (d)CMP kinase [Candidatus Puniceispirillales bacterium]
MIEIAIDGTAASGKGTLGKKLSYKYSFPYLDTGLLYRKVAYDLIKRNKLDQTKLEQTCCDFATILTFKELKNTNLRTEEVAKLASKIATFPNLRKILNDKQKEFSNFNKKQFGGCILDGRDIGTTILPNADFKFFITASIEVRAKRRLLQKNISFLHENDEKCMLQTLINDMKERDKLDSNRKTSPLVPAKDAHVIDTTIINSQELLLIVTNIIEGKNELLK